MARKLTKTHQKTMIWVAILFALLVLGYTILTFLNDSMREPENPGILQTIQGLQQKEQLPDGAKRITFDSPNPERPNMYIGIEETDTILFERSVISQEGKPITLTQYLASYGEPEKILQGTRFYGSDTNLYIYARNGVAFIAEPQRNRVLELHTFPVMTTDSYLQKYGNEN